MSFANYLYGYFIWGQYVFFWAPFSIPFNEGGRQSCWAFGWQATSEALLLTVGVKRVWLHKFKVGIGYQIGFNYGLGRPMIHVKLYHKKLAPPAKWSIRTNVLNMCYSTSSFPIPHIFSAYLSYHKRQMNQYCLWGRPVPPLAFHNLPFWVRSARKREL